MIIDIDIETLFPEGLSDEAISAICYVCPYLIPRYLL